MSKQTMQVRQYTDADYRAMMPGTPLTIAQTLRAFHGDPKIKARYLQRLKIHAKADEIVHGYYWENGKGCAVGCTIHSGDHSAYESELGIPRVLARLEDRIFEGMGNGDSKHWPSKFLSAIKPGADLGLVWPKFAVWLLADPTHGVIRFARTDSRRKSIQAVADAHQSVVDGTATMVDWFKLRTAAAAADAADDAAAADAYAAAYAAADAAADAYAAAYAAADAAAADAYAAYAYADAAADARRKAYVAQSVKLLEILESA